MCARQYYKTNIIIFSELIRNHTLKYLSRTLPILRADDTLPKVAQLQEELDAQNT